MVSVNCSVVIFILCDLFLFGYTANILFVSVTPSVSHQSVFQPIWKELSLRGHKVHAITTVPLNDPKLTNLTEIDLSSLFDLLNQHSNNDTVKYLITKPSFPTVFIKDGIMTYIWSKLSEKAFEHENMQKFLKEHHEFDVAIIEWLYPTMAAFGAKYNVPIIGITSLGAPIPALDTLGNPSHPIAAPDHNLPVTRDMPFRERLMSVLYSVYVRVFYHLVVLPREDKLAKRFLGDDLPYIGDIERNVSLLLLNRNPVIHRPMPMVPAVIELNGIKVAKTVQKMEPDLKEFLDNSKNGAIYFSLGSSIKSTYLPDDVYKAFITVFSNLPYNVIWKFEADDWVDKPKNVFVQKWLPQTSILDHPNLKLFIMQGGLQSTEEAITSQVPIIGIPFQSDQTANVDTLVKYGMGISIDLEDITVERLNNSIFEIILKPSYKENAVKVSKLLYDKPVDGLQKAIWWIEYVIRHKGARHLRSHAMDIPWYQYLMLDILGTLFIAIGIIILMLFLTVKCLGILIRKLCSSKTDEKKKKE